MLSKSPGVRRLAILAAVVAGAASFIARFGTTAYTTGEIVTLAALIASAAWVFVHFAAWTIEGFRKPQ